MAHSISLRGFAASVAQVLEHSALVVMGLVLAVVGLGLGVTMIMLPVGIVIGLLGVLMIVGGLFAHID